MDRRQVHDRNVAVLQEQVRRLYHERTGPPVSLKYNSEACNTTRSKSYKDGARSIEFGGLNSIIHIDIEKRKVLVEPRVTIEQLVQATLPYGLSVPVIPEFKGISVGGAIMGGATESTACTYGLFNDVCTAFEIVCGDGSLVRATPDENADLFYGIPGSYGSLGALVLAEITLTPIQEFVLLHYHVFSHPSEAIDLLRTLCQTSVAPYFLDGIVFSKDLAVVVEGRFCSKETIPSGATFFSLRHLSSEWYYQHVENIASHSRAQGYDEVMTFQEYVFRYDRGAFWMGAYLCKPLLFAQFLIEGLFKLPPPFKRDIEADTERFHTLKSPNVFFRVLLHRLMTSQRLWKLFHTAESYVHKRALIQDFCIPELHAKEFFSDVCNEAGTFPLWLCPIQGTKTPQIFSPHLLSSPKSYSHFINIGVYGLPSNCVSVEGVTRKLEKITKRLGGRKVLYSRSYYSPDEFWQIYPRTAYEALREKTHAREMWHDITEKVLSE